MWYLIIAGGFWLAACAAMFLGAWGQDTVGDKIKRFTIGLFAGALFGIAWPLLLMYGLAAVLIWAMSPGKSFAESTGEFLKSEMRGRRP